MIHKLIHNPANPQNKGRKTGLFIDFQHEVVHVERISVLGLV